jgi:hypothetical protein
MPEAHIIFVASILVAASSTHMPQYNPMQWGKKIFHDGDIQVSKSYECIHIQPASRHALNCPLVATELSRQRKGMFSDQGNKAPHKHSTALD